METKLKILMIGSDRKLFEEGSAVSARMKEYGALVDELHIIVFTKKSLNLKEKKISSNVWAYPTNSLSRWFYIGDAARFGKKLVSEKGFIRGHSVISAQDPFECGLAALRVKRKWRLPLELQLHTDPFSFHFSGFLNFLRKRIAKRILRHADGIRVVSDVLKTRVSSLVSAHISTLPVFVDKEKIASAPLAFDLRARLGWSFVLLCVARLTPEKNLSLAVRTLALVRKKLPGAGLVFVGSGPEEGKLKSLARKLGVSDYVHFAGWQTETASYFKTSSVFLQTSAFEGYGMALVEAGLFGLPVVTTPVGVAAELKDGQEAFLCPPQSPEVCAEAVLKIAGDNQLRELLKANMREFLNEKLLDKEQYLDKMRENWERTSARIS